MAAFTNDFSWSWSRHRALATCRRQYYFAHYGFWGGWNRDATPLARQLYLEKKLTTRGMWIGTAVHAAVEGVLKQVGRGRYPEPVDVVARVVAQAEAAVRDSRAGRYRENPKRYPGFACHYFGDPEDLDGLAEEAAEITTSVFKNPALQRLSAVPERIREVERLEQLTVGDVPVWVSLDVLVADGQGGYVVIDWKTGSHHDLDQVRQQLGIYALYVLSRYLGGASSDVGRVKTMMVNLRSGEQEVHLCDDGHLAEATGLVRSSAATMRGLLRNILANEAHIDDFPVLEVGAPACERCLFRRSCGR